MTHAAPRAAHPAARHLFARSLDHSRLLIGLGVLVAAVLTAGLLRLEKDPSTDALLDPSDPAVIARDHVEAVFGLKDPMIVAVEMQSTMLTPQGLALLSRLHERIEAIEGVRPDRVRSLASEAPITGNADAILVEDYLADLPTSEAEAEAVGRRALAFAPHRGTLLSEDGSMATIVAEFYPDADTDRAYAAAMRLAADVPGATVHVAGQGAVTGYLSASIDADARRLPPLAVLIVLGVVYLAFRRPAAMPCLALVLVAAVGGTIGTMGWLGSDYYVITSALPIVLTAVAVADTIHVLSAYLARRRGGGASPKEDMVATLADLWRPLTLTTATTMMGFLGIALSADMPPMALFGWYAVLGSALAWAYSLFVLPSLMLALRVEPGPRTGPDALGAAATSAALLSASRPGFVLAGGAGLLILAVVGASEVRFDSDRQALFPPDEPIRQADQAINAGMAGTSYLDVVVEAPDGQDLLTADAARTVERVRTALAAQPGVGKAVAFTDVIAALQAATAGPGAEFLPSDDDRLAQLMLLYEVSADSEDLEDEIDPEYRRALVRAYVPTSVYSEYRPILDAVRDALPALTEGTGLTASMSGRLAVDGAAMSRLRGNHFASIGLAFSLVVVTAIALFRSVGVGLLAAAPLTFAISCVYGVMGAGSIFVEPSTSMFAAIAIGVGIDFAIHLVDRLTRARRAGLGAAEAVRRHFPVAGRACLVNALALTAGFCVLLTSDMPSVARFGLLVSLSAAVSFAAALLLLPAAFALLERGVAREAPPTGAARRAVVSLAACAVVVAAVGPAAVAQEASADAPVLSPTERAERMNGRADGEQVTRGLTMVRVSRNGSVQEREATSYRTDGPDGERRSLLVYDAPRSIRGTAFLTHDRAGGADRRWLFMPSRGSAMRIPDAKRGKAFLGTGFTYEDLKSELKASPEDYDFVATERPADAEAGLAYIEARPKTAAIAKELGYGRVVIGIDPDTDVPRHMLFWDTKDRPLKTIRVSRVERVDGIATAREIAVDHHQKGHVTTFTYGDVRYGEGRPFGRLLPEEMGEAP